MARNVCPLLTMALLVAMFGPSVTSATEETNRRKPLRIDGIRLYRKIAAANPGKNLLISPVAISMALRMVYLGSDGSTKAQIEAATQLSDSEKGNPNSSSYSVTKYVPLRAKSTLLRANRVYGPSDAPFKDSYLELIGEEYGVTIETLDFRGDAERARRAINFWVEQITLQRVKDIFPRGSIANDSKLIVVSALVFRAMWTTMFAKEDTRLQKFHLANGSDILVPMMRRGPSYAMQYANNTQHGFEVLMLSFKGYRRSMYFVLPHRNRSLAAVENLMETNDEVEYFKHTIASFVKMSIPKFRLKQAHDLNEPLKQIGIVDAFDIAKANFSKLSDSAGLALTKATHKSALMINERGTGFQMTPGYPSGFGFPVTTTEKPIRFVLNRPFLFLVPDRSTGTIIFRGRVMNPLEVN